ncbi:uncharacterized protein [Macrobrachium rosenbergii]|uniref:uncharacterized protein isoform X2 n=1 Tax=Macrobrachium rosenbergii TaxID=79674 RepID=UPI0034D553BB
MPDSSVISNYSSGDLLAEDISRSPPNSPRGKDNTVSNNSVCEDMLLSHDSTAASLELSKNKIADLDLSTDTALSTAARSENLVESEEPQYPCQVNQESTMEKRISSGIALVTPCPVGEKSPDPVTEKSEFLPSDDSDDSNLAVNESETNNVSSETVMDKTKVVSTDSSVLDAPMSLSKDTSENSYLVPEETPITESLANKSNYLSVVDNDSETNFSAIHNTSHFQEEVLAAKEKEDNSSDKVEEFIHMAENSPSDSCKLNNTSDIAEYSPAPSLYSSVENSPISMCNSPPSPSSDEDMNSSEDSLPFTFRPGRNYDLNDVDTEADLPINNEPQETDITPDMEQDINKINRKGLKRGRSPSPVALNRDISSVATDSHNSSDESEDQVLNCQKRLKISSSGGRLVMNKQACKLFAAQDSKKQVLKRQKSVRGMLIELYESSGHKGIFTPKLYHQKRRLRTITTRSLVKKLKRRTPNHDLKYISQKRMDLIKAVEEGNMPKIQELIQDMGPAVREEKTGSTLLHVAVAHNQVDAVLFLLRLISPNVVNNEGETPAHLAAFMGHTQILRILLTDEELCYEKKNRQGRTYTNLLSAPLCDAVLGKDRNKAQELLRLGADPDYDVGDVVEGQLPPDVQVALPQSFATDFRGLGHIVIFPKKKCDIAKKVREPDVVFTSNSVISNSDEGKHYPDPVEIEVTPAQEPPEGDVYPVNTEPRGFVCILDYNAFRDRQDLDLEGSMQDISNLASIFSKMGYAGEIYSSPTADETTEILQNVREKDILKEVGCLTVVVNSHGVGEDRFLTSDLKSLDISRTCGLFKDSECTHMVNKPKIFLFNTGSGLYRESKKARYSKPLTTRVSEPLRDALCLFSSHSGFASWAYSDKGTPFYLAFCNTLAKHAHSMEINDLFRELLKEYGKTSPVTVPELRNIGFSKKFFFNPVP